MKPKPKTTATSYVAKVKRKTTNAKVLAEAIAKRLFTSGDGALATRLELKRWNETENDEVGLGGWCFKSAVEQIKQVLLEARPR